MSIINNTPHYVNIFSGAEFDPIIQKYRGGSFERTIEPSGVLLNAKIQEIDDEPIDGIATKRTSIISADPIPDDGNYHIVSQLYLSAARQSGWDTSRLLTIGGAVVDYVDHTIGASFLIRN